MQDLRLVGVHDDGEHLLLSGTAGAMFRLPINEALRLAASRPSARPSAGTPVAMSPRDIQAKIRSGSTAAEVAAASGMPQEKVERYEGPVLAERAYIAQQAQKVEVASPAPGHDVYRSAFGDNPATLGDMVAHRLTAHGIQSSTLEWDSWRRPDGTWTVVAKFEAAAGGHASIGEEPPAMWTFNPTRKSLQNANRWAQQLSELEPLDGPVPARRLSAVSDRPFDFETDAAAAARTGIGAGMEQQKDPDGLLDMLRSRRGQRLGVDEDSDDALALLLANGVPAAHPRAEEAPAGTESEAPAEGSAHPGDSAHPDAAAHSDGAAQDDAEHDPETGAQENDGDGAAEAPAAEFTLARRRDGRPSMVSRLNLVPRHEDIEDESLKLHDGVSTHTREITIVPGRPAPEKHGPAKPEDPVSPAAQSPSPVTGRPAPAKPGLDELLGRGNARRRLDGSRLEGTRPQPGQGTSGTDQDRDEPERQPSRPKRSSVPSWDEIVFGTRGD
ncbi:septation protein SepH [uncultured Arthrobacter sp.]|uniref:septation protein SepH n=1 Tax=uncultured Arthrobacter sp. TaxID=114050 RepID=UPI0028D4D38A|nr:septation protein SepH [uncultured Arthrobacter sp.]